jgi:hypothetical protein
MPDWKDLVSQRLQHVWPDGNADTDVIDELTAHLQDRYDELRTAGHSEREAIEATLNEMIDRFRRTPGHRRSHDRDQSDRIHGDRRGAAWLQGARPCVRS